LAGAGHKVLAAGFDVESAGEDEDVLRKLPDLAIVHPTAVAAHSCHANLRGVSIDPADDFIELYFRKVAELHSGSRALAVEARAVAREARLLNYCCKRSAVPIPTIGIGRIAVQLRQIAMIDDGIVVAISLL